MTGSPSHVLGQYDPDQNLYEILRDRSRERSLPHLVVEAVLSIVTSVAIALLRPHWWALYLPFIILACYSVWGLLDRASRPIGSDPLRRTVIGIDWIVAAAGTSGALLFLYRITGYLLGNWVL